MENNLDISSPMVKPETEEKMKQVIDGQTRQMMTLIDVANAHSAENDILRNKLIKIEKDNDELKSSNRSLRDMFNVQTILFVLLILILFLFFYCYKKN